MVRYCEICGSPLKRFESDVCEYCMFHDMDEEAREELEEVSE